MELILLRHPPPAVDSGICYGRSELALRDDPHTAASELGTLLARHSVRGDLLVSSPATRCASVALPLARSLGLGYAIDARLLEMDFGSWEMRAWDDIDRAQLDAWAADLDAADPPHLGEALPSFARRIGSWLDEICADPPPETIALTHAGVIRVLTALALGLSSTACLGWRLDFGALCRLRRSSDGHWSIANWNVRG